jgi:hypothetical protein
MESVEVGRGWLKSNTSRSNLLGTCTDVNQKLLYNHLINWPQKPRGALALDEYFIFRLYTMSIGAPVRELWLERFRVQMWRF